MLRVRTKHPYRLYAYAGEFLHFIWPVQVTGPFLSSMLCIRLPLTIPRLLALLASALLLYLYLSVHTTFSSSYLLWSQECSFGGPVLDVMWSWDFSRRCCDVHPSNGESTSVADDPTYLGRRDMQNGSVVYVKYNDFGFFLHKFLALPVSHRITLVTGMEDYGPVEIFSPRSRLGSAPPISLAQFLLDSRLKSWFAQNYDVGCSVTTQGCLNVSAEFPAVPYSHHRALAKIRPVPLGIDLHTWADKGDMKSPTFQAKVCLQKRQLDDTRTSLAMRSFDAKDLKVVSSFSCVFKNPNDVRKRVRGELCRLLAALPSAGRAALLVQAAGKGEAARLAFWRLLQAHTFALAPSGAGLDTHRLYEILFMGSIPIVLSSPMDAFYTQNFPILIVESWEQAFNKTLLAAGKARLRRQFGVDRAGRMDASARLAVDYWVAQVAGHGRSAADGGETKDTV